MRRKDREVTDQKQIYEIIDSCQICRLGFCDEGEAYIVPLNFGYIKDESKTTFYFHSAFEGRKINLIKKNNRVCFEIDTAYKLIETEKACGYSAYFQSIIGYGKVSFVEDISEKEEGLQSIMYQTTKKRDFTFNEQDITRVCIFKLEVESLSCKAKD